MIHIATLNDTRFTLNGTEYLKNYISVVKGGRLEIFNCYERQDVLIPLTDCNQISLNGSVYETAEELQSALLPVIYSRFTMGDGSTYMQNNKGRTISLGYLATGNTPYNEVLSKINAISFIVTETESPVIVNALKIENGLSKKYTFLFLGGKGTWGLNGSSVAPFNLLQLAPEAVTVNDIQEDDNSVIISLPDITEGSFITEANAVVRDFSDTEKAYYFSYIENGILYISKFIGEPGLYGGQEMPFNNADFVSTTNTAIEPGPATPTLNEVITAGNVINDSVVIFLSGSEKLEVSEEGLDYKKDEKQLNIRFSELAADAQGITTFTIPTKNTNDEFAMISDINNLSLERVLENGNSANTAIYLHDYEFSSEYDSEAPININGRINLNSGNANAFAGKGAGKDNVGNYNTGYGAYALLRNSSGNSNTAVGYSSLWQNLTGLSNVAVGSSTLSKSNSDGNVAVGYVSLSNLTTGYRNCSIGRAAGLDLTIGNGNTVFGYQVFASNASGNYNTVIGCSAMQNATGGSSNIWIGGMSTNNFSVNISQGSYNTVIGTDLILTDSEKVGSNQILIADGQGNRAFSANTVSGELKLMGKNVLLVHPDSPIQLQNVWIDETPVDNAAGTLYLIEDTTTEFFGDYSTVASGTITVAIPHGLGVIPIWVNVTAASSSAIGPFCIDKDEVNIILTYAAPPSGTLKYNIAYRS